MDEILKYEPEFTEAKFKTCADNIFIQLHLALVTKELENIKHFVSDEVYNKYQNKLDELNKKHLIQMYDEINVAQTDILSYKVDNENMIIEVNILSRYLDYLMDEDANYISGDTDVRSVRANYVMEEEGNYVSGDTDIRTEKNNHLIFTKKINYEKSKTVRKCPGCGASIDVNASGKCEYCGTIYNLEDKDWVLKSIDIKE